MWTSIPIHMQESIWLSRYTTSLKRVMQEQGRKQKWLAEQLDINRDVLNRIVNGATLPNLRTAQKIAQILNVEINTLWPYGDGD